MLSSLRPDIPAWAPGHRANLLRAASSGTTAPAWRTPVWLFAVLFALFLIGPALSLAADSLGPALGPTLLLAGVGTAFVGILLLASETQRFAVAAAMAASAGLSYAIIGYVYSPVSSYTLLPPSALGSSLMVGLSILFLTRRYLSASAPIPVSLGLYLVVGALALVVAAQVGQFAQVPRDLEVWQVAVVLFPVWPTGVALMLLGDSVLSPGPLVALFWVARIFVVGAAAGSLVYLRRNMGKKTEPRGLWTE